MWNDQKSLVLSRVSVGIFSVLYVLVLLTCPVLVRSFIAFREMNPGMAVYFMASIYSCALPAGKLLWDLHRFLKNISQDLVFIDQNVALLRSISWCCIAAGIICLFSCTYYMIYFFLAVAAAFIGLITRVIKNVFRQAVCIKAENDFTI